MTEIDKAYDKLLKASDNIDLSDDSISFDDVAKKMGEIEKDLESAGISTTAESIDDIKIDYVPEDSIHEPEAAIGKYDPETGDITVSESSPVSVKEFSEKQFRSFISTDDDEIKIDEDRLASILPEQELADTQDMLTIVSLVSRRMKGENFDPYPEFPMRFKLIVNDMMIKLNTSNIKSNAIRSRSYVAKKVLDEIVEEYKKEVNASEIMDLDSMLAGFNDSIKKISDETQLEMGSAFMSFDEERTIEIDAAIEKCKAEGKDEAVERLLKIKSVLNKAFTLEDFAEFCLNCKIKNRELREPQKVFGNFNYKYEKHKNAINDISYCPTVLSRHLTNYTEDQRLALCIAFCKYCMNMNPDNIEEHTFMYYFIRNIIVIDRVNPKGKMYEAMKEREKTFYDNYVNALSTCINNLIKRNQLT